MPKDKVEGILLINKPRNISSFDVIRIIRRITNIKKVGHAGTLDPEAEGLLVILIGRNATKYSSIFLKQPKRYLFEVIFGIKTTGADRDGYIVDTKSRVIDKKILESAIERFKGTISQKPHMFSAVHHKGKRLYEIASLGESIDIQPREVHIYEIFVKDFTSGDYPCAQIEVLCSSGTYIRSLVEDIGDSLDNYAFISRLVRIDSGSFNIKQSHKISDLKENEINDKIINIKEVVCEVKNSQ